MVIAENIWPIGTRRKSTRPKWGVHSWWQRRCQLRWGDGWHRSVARIQCCDGCASPASCNSTMPCDVKRRYDVEGDVNTGHCPSSIALGSGCYDLWLQRKFYYEQSLICADSQLGWFISKLCNFIVDSICDYMSRYKRRKWNCECGKICNWM